MGSNHAGKVLWLAGYGAWPSSVRADRLVAALAERGVTSLADIRLNPASSDAREGRYGPKPWTLQAGRAGIAGLLEPAGIAYEWIVELGNPQRHDPRMTILRAHLGDPGAGWPVHRGLDRLIERLRRPGEVVAILCACAEYRVCHRALIGRSVEERWKDGRLTIRDLRTGDVLSADRSA